MTTGIKVVIVGGNLDVSGNVHPTGNYFSADDTEGSSAVTGGLTFKNGIYTGGTIDSGVSAWGSKSSAIGTIGATSVYTRALTIGGVTVHVVTTD